MTADLGLEIIVIIQKFFALDCSSISGSTTRTLTVPDTNGTIATQAYVQAQITAEDS